MKKLVLLLITIILTLSSACSESSLKNSGKEPEDTLVNAVDSGNKYVLMVKNGYRENNPDLTYETAFSTYFGTPHWKYYEGDEGQDVVEFTGDCIYRDVAVNARIQFIVDDEKETFEATYLAFNEVPQDTVTLVALITTAFEDKETQSVYSDDLNYDNTASNDDNSTHPANGVRTEINTSDIVMYKFSTVDFGEVPDFLAFVSNGDEISNNTNCEIVEVNLGIQYYYRDRDVLPGYIDLLENMGFELISGGDDYSQLEKGDINIFVSKWSRDGGVAIDISYTHYSDEPSDDYYSDNDWGYEDSGFRRSDYFTGISRIDLLRYPDNYSYSSVYFGPYKVMQVYEPKLYLVQNNTLLSSDYIIIDDRGNSGANALVGDVVSVYGVFYGNETITWTNGNNEQVPVIGVDLLIFNNLPPTPEDFAQALVSSLNINQNAVGNNSQYISGSTVRLVGAVNRLGNIQVLSGGSAGYAAYVDGYGTTIQWQFEWKLDPSLQNSGINAIEEQSRVSAFQDFGINLSEIPAGTAGRIWVTGSIVSIVPNALEPSIITVSIEVENIETYHSEE